jgi:hypothetical protein
MYFYYPYSVAETGKADLTNQDGNNTKEMVMFGTCDYSTNPNIKFENRTAILKLNIPIPEGITFVKDTELYVKVIGAYSKGNLNKAGNWLYSSPSVINVRNAKITSDNRVSAYVVILPGSYASNLRIHVGGKVSDTEYKNFVTDVYTSKTATIKAGQIITVNKSTNVPVSNYTTEAKGMDLFYMWDADQPNSAGTASTTAITSSDNATNMNVTNDWLKACPTYEQTSILLGNGVFNVKTDTEDTGSEVNMPYGNPTQTWKTHYSGIWLKKFVYCDNTKRASSVTPLSVMPDLGNGQYFFLPARGEFIGSKISYIGVRLKYWICNAPKGDAANAYYLYWDDTNNKIIINSGTRKGCYIGWSIE